MLRPFEAICITRDKRASDYHTDEMAKYRIDGRLLLGPREGTTAAAEKLRPGAS